MRIAHILFDLDNTLYKASSGLFDEIRTRMTGFVARFFNVGEQEAAAIRQGYGAKYGTTLGGLLQEGGLRDPEEYLASVHPRDVGAYITPDPGLRPMLVGLPYPKSIITNSPREHALRVLEFLGVADCFGRVFDIRFCNYQGKPMPEAYRLVLTELGRKIENALLVDDVKAYLEAYAALGGPVVQVREDGIASGGWPCLKDVKELPGILETLSRPA
jgi:putative hydrolase of the HAD superfamily